eukprot:TRINITY_DN2939_c0_g1_i2.p1 TRINITY_DN2939_c0_g1~~TRINITY_DN2939_c0_g1_i2.p1  ORF type:complete len:154 (-),score=13.26 TRINITY_DN2939_c0_g1_i2:124-585(-)
MAIVANVLVVLWRFWERFLEVLMQRRRTIMKSLIARRGNRLDYNMNLLLRRTYRTGMKRSIVYFLCALLLYSKHAWKRTLGLLLSSTASLYLVYSEPHRMNLGNYFALFANILYGTASWSLSTRAKHALEPVPTSSGFVQRTKHFFLQALETF